MQDQLAVTSSADKAVYGAYLHFGELGGRRNPVAGSPNGGWRERGFRGYSDYMASAEFEAGLQRRALALRGERLRPVQRQVEMAATIVDFADPTCG